MWLVHYKKKKEERHDEEQRKRHTLQAHTTQFLNSFNGLDLQALMACTYIVCFFHRLARLAPPDMFFSCMHLHT